MMSVRDELRKIADGVRERRQGTLDSAIERRAEVWRALAQLGLVDMDDKFTVGRMGKRQYLDDLQEFNKKYFPDLDMEALIAGETIKLDDIEFGFRGSTKTITGRTLSSIEDYLELLETMRGIMPRGIGSVPDASSLAALAEFTSVEEAFTEIDIANGEIDFYEKEIDNLQSNDVETVVKSITSVELDNEEIQALESLRVEEEGGAYATEELELIRAIDEALDRETDLTPTDESADRVLMERAPSEPEPEVEEPERAVHPLYGEDTTLPEKDEAVHPLWSDFGRTPEQMDYDAVAGFASAFLEARDEAGDFLVGLTEDKRVVRADDKDAVRTIRLDELVRDRNLDPDTDEGIAEIQRLVRFTDWYSDNSDYTRQFQTEWYNNAGSLPQQRAMISDTALRIESVLRDLGQIGAFSEEQIYDLAFEIQSVNQHATDTQLRRAVIAHIESDLEESATSTTAQTANDLQSLARKYFVTLSDEQASDYSMQIYAGTMTEDQLEMMWRDQASSRFPTLSNYLSDGFTVADYFASYEAEMSQMLDRPVDLYTEFPQVFDYVADTGEQRPMTFGEMREFARRMPEWQQSQQGQDQARSISFALAQMFGQAA